MIQFNSSEKLTPTVLRRRVETVKRELRNYTSKENAAKLEVDEQEEKLISSKERLGSCHRNTQSLHNQLGELESELARAKKRSNQQIVSDHAVCSFIERVLGIDVQSIRNQIIGNDGKKIREMETDGSIDRDKYSLVVAGGVITTVITDTMNDLNPLSKSTYTTGELV